MFNRETLNHRIHPADMILMRMGGHDGGKFFDALSLEVIDHLSTISIVAGVDQNCGAGRRLDEDAVRLANVDKMHLEIAA
ncbi:hypothetical protein JCM15765_33290 [Paradesulfitobacterium aromaticivorans]